MNLSNLLDEQSIILRIGDLKISDTGDTFGRESFVNGYFYVPLKDPKSSSLDINGLLADGDARRCVSIRKDSTEVFLIYGANRVSSNAQSMAIGFKSDSGYYCIKEHFKDIYEKEPILSSRILVRCESLFNINKNDSIKEIFNATSPEKIETPTDSDKKSFKALMSRISKIEPGLTQANLDQIDLRKIREVRKRNAKNISEK